LAINRGDKDKNTDFLDCTAWNKTAEFLCSYFKKGNLVAAEGTVRTNNYEKDGERRKSTEIWVNKVHFTGDYKKEETQSTSGFEAIEDDGDLPF
jgi:single-strand DNA-binding protein